ncbi:MAG: conjugal transfer protein TrbF, partial [Rhizobiaceae bacterium]
SRVVPYIVELDADGGARPVRAATETYTPTDAQIAYHLARFIEKVRGLPTDPIVVRRNWLRAYDFATARATNTLNSWARNNDPFAKVGRESIAVNVTSVVRASPSSFQVRWRERRYLNGSLASTNRWTALATVAIDPPSDLDTLRKNPLGIYVTALNWSQELDGSASRQFGKNTVSRNGRKKREDEPFSVRPDHMPPDVPPPKPDLPAITDPRKR